MARLLNVRARFAGCFYLFCFAVLASTITAGGSRNSIRARESTRPRVDLAFNRHGFSHYGVAAAFLAGLEYPTELDRSDLIRSPSWPEYNAMADRAWARWGTTVRPRIVSWAKRELDLIDLKYNCIYYPFSGPDLLFPITLFPDADTYVLTGLEPPGDIHSWREEATRLESISEAAKSHLRDLLGFSFFRRNDLVKAQGTLDIVDMLFIILARQGFHIVDAARIIINGQAKIETFCPGQIQDPDSDPIHGVRIRFQQRPESGIKTLYYFSTDLSDLGMIAHPEYIGFLDNWPSFTTIIKAASYLPHYERFSSLRDFLISHSSLILQDDSGIPLADFMPDSWVLTLFGTYRGPIELFSDFYQIDLMHAYKRANPARLEFGFGYRHRPDDSCIILARQINRGNAPEPCVIQQISINGVDSGAAVVTANEPIIHLRFSVPIDPLSVLVYIRKGKSAPIGLDLSWTEDHLSATGKPIRALSEPGIHQIVFCPAACDQKGLPIVDLENWSFCYLDSSLVAAGRKSIYIDRANQQVFLCGPDGLIQRAFVCATGQYYPTIGLHQIKAKYLRSSSLFDDSTFSFFSVFQESESGHNVGFHSIPRLKNGSFVGRLGYPESHGCVRLSPDDANCLYEWAEIGTPVTVF